MCVLCDLQYVVIFVPLAWLKRHHVSPILFCAMFPTMLVGMVVGVSLLLVLPSEPVQLVLAIVVFVAALWRWGGTIQESLQQRRRHGQLQPVVAAAQPAEDSAEDEAAGIELVEGSGSTVIVVPATRSPPAAAAGVAVLPAEVLATPPSAQASAPVLATLAVPASSATLQQRCLARLMHSKPTARVGIGGAIAGLVSGTLLGLVGTGGPPIMMFVTIAKLDKSLSKDCSCAGAAFAVRPTASA